MDQWAFFDEFKAGTVRNVYLFYGPEAYIRKSALATMQKKLLMPGLESMNCTFMQSPSAQQIIENCETLPMMGDWRLVVVQGLELLESGEERLGVLALITRQYRQMMYAKDMMDSRMPQPQMMKALGVPSFALNKLMRRAGRRTMEQLRGQLELCVQTDYDIKRGAVREEAGLDL